jgi:hypothetical protein
VEINFSILNTLQLVVIVVALFSQYQAAACDAVLSWFHTAASEQVNMPIINSKAEKLFDL